MSVCQVPSRVKDASDIFAFCVYPVGDLAHAHEKSISATDLQDIYTPKGLAKRAERTRLQDCKGVVRVGDVYDEATVERATSRVDEVMGQPVQIQQETKPDSQSHSPA